MVQFSSFIVIISKEFELRLEIFLIPWLSKHFNFFTLIPQL